MPSIGDDRPRSPCRNVVVESRQQLAPQLVRIVATGELEQWPTGAPSGHCKVFIPRANGGEAAMRTHTVRAHGSAAGRLTIDIALDPDGPATAFALSAQPGDAFQGRRARPAMADRAGRAMRTARRRRAGAEAAAGRGRGLNRRRGRRDARDQAQPAARPRVLTHARSRPVRTGARARSTTPTTTSVRTSTEGCAAICCGTGCEAGAPRRSDAYTRQISAVYMHRWPARLRIGAAARRVESRAWPPAPSSSPN